VSNPQPQVEFTNGVSVIVNGERVWFDSGSYTVSRVIWHGVAINPADTQLSYATSPNAVWKIQANVFTVRVALKGVLTGFSADGAVVTIRLPSGETMTAATSNGVATFNQVPAGSYTAIISAWPFTRTVQVDVKADVDVSFSMLLPIELAAALGVGATGIVGTVFFHSFSSQRRREPW